MSQSAGIAVLAVGGYGRGELSPHSDIDLLFCVAGKTDITPATLRGLLYPLWDAGFQIGHAVRSPKEAIERSGADLEAATSLLSARLIAGDEGPLAELLDRRARWMRKESRSLTRRILDTRAARHQRVDRAGWSLAPDLKEDAGGLRDLHAVGWLASLASTSIDSSELLAAHGTFMAVREALHAEVARKTDRLRIDLQPPVAARLGWTDEDGADELMRHVHAAARVVEHNGSLALSELAEAIDAGPRRSGSSQSLSERVRVQDGSLVAGALGPGDVEVALEVLAASSETGRSIERRTLDRLAAVFRTDPLDRWSSPLRASFLGLLRGSSPIPALELLDHLHAWPVLLPEWTNVRGRAQHDPYHRYTVDGHSFIAVDQIHRVIAEDPLARTAAHEAGDLDPLLVATLLHDVGKGSGADHSIAGERLARSACTRMGLESRDAEEVASLVRRHLLLVDTATRRDLDDGSVIESVRDLVGTGRFLRLLYILSAADGRATGAEAWTEWKAALVRELYRKVLVALETGELPARSDVRTHAREIEAFDPSLAGRAEELLSTLPQSYLSSVTVPDMADELRLLARPPALGEVRWHVYDGAEPGHAALTVCVLDRPGTLARTAGVLALNRISVLKAQAYSTTGGFALERFLVQPPQGGSWERLEQDLAAVYSGRLALEARLERKAADYRPAQWAGLEVRVLQDESEHSSVVEVRAQDAVGLLYAIAAALSDLDLDIHVAKIDTLGTRVVDVFYVRTLWATKLSPEQTAEVERAIAHRIERFFGPTT